MNIQFENKDLTTINTTTLPIWIEKAFQRKLKIIEFTKKHGVYKTRHYGFGTAQNQHQLNELRMRLTWN